MHNYAFTWRNESITWYVDGKSVLTMTSNLPEPIQLQLIANTWRCVPSPWAGIYAPAIASPNVQSTYESISYQPLEG